MTDTDVMTATPSSTEQAQNEAPGNSPEASTIIETTPKCTATTTDTDVQVSSAPETGSTTTDSNSPFIKTALAAANLIEQLRQHPEAYAFLDALLKCLEPPKPKP